jgi:hypothetical protein
MFRRSSLSASRAAVPGTWHAHLWITGAAGFTDAGDPNASPPSAGRILTIPPFDRFAQGFAAASPPTYVGGGWAVNGALADGTSATLRSWWKDDTLGIWFPVGTVSNLNYASNNQSNFSGVALPGQKWFLQVLVNNGVTKIGHFFK